MSELNPVAPLSPSARRPTTLSRFLRNPSFVTGAAILTVCGLMALLAGVIYPGSPLSMVGSPLLWPGQDSAFPLGTDSMGRDIAAGMVHGARVSLLVGLAATLVGSVIGIFVGAIAGFFGGVVDLILRRFIEIFQTIPSFLLVIVLVAIGGSTIEVIILSIGIASWPPIARLVRAEFRSLRNAEFVLASRSLGYGDIHILWREILPNALPSIIVAMSLMVAHAILTEAGLAFINMRDINLVSWGGMIGEGREFIRSAWYLAALPGLAIILTVLSLNLVGDGLNDLLNPRSDER